MPMSPHIADLRAKIGHALIMAPGVAAVIANERGEVVLQRRSDNGLWGVPGGGIEPGEEPAETLVREIWEETGLKVVPERITGVYGGADLRHVYPNQDRVQLIDIVFMCRVIGGELAIQHDNESLEVRYFALDALPADMMAHHQMYIDEAFRGRTAAHFRYQPGTITPMTTALVTGGTGFLGSHIVHTLLDAGHTVHILRRASSPLGLLDGLPIEHWLGDVTDPASLEQAMQGCEWVFHVAAVADYWRANLIKMYLVNVNGTINVLNAAHKTGVRRVILTSSGAAIGFRPDGQPADETVPFNLPPKRFPYGHSKYLAELEAMRAVEQGQDVVILNPVTIFGPGDQNLISGTTVIEVARGSVAVYPVGGMTVIDVRDVAAAHLAAAERGRRGERYLIGAEDYTHRAALNMVADMVGVPRPFIPVPAAITPALAEVVGLLRRMGVPIPIDADQIRLSARDIYFDCRKAWNELGQPRISTRQSLEDTYHWYVEHGFIKR